MLNPNWIYKGDLFMAVNITGIKTDVYDKDLDTLKGIVFEDDRQIIKLSAEKQNTTLSWVFYIRTRYMVKRTRSKDA